MDLLIRAGADVKATSEGNSALHIATYIGNPNIINRLILEGVEVNQKNDKGETPLDLAVEEGNNEVVQLLKQHGAIQ